MGYSKGIQTIGINVSLPRDRIQSQVRIYDSAYWAEIVKGKDAASVTSKVIASTYPARSSPFLHFKYRTLVNHENSALVSQVCCKSLWGVKKWSVRVYQSQGVSFLEEGRRRAGLKYYSELHEEWWARGETAGWKVLSVLRIQEGFYRMGYEDG